MVLSVCMSCMMTHGEQQRSGAALLPQGRHCLSGKIPHTQEYVGPTFGCIQHGDDCDNACALGCAGMLFPQNTGQAAPGQRLVAERRWRLGVHSRGHPHRVIEDLLRALHALSVSYKKLAPYNYKCRKLYPARGEHTAAFRGLTPSAPHLVPLMNFDRAVPVSRDVLRSGRPG